MWTHKRELDEQAARHDLKHLRKIAPPMCKICDKVRVRRPGQICKACKKAQRNKKK